MQHKRLGGWRPKTLYLPFPTLGYIGMAARGVLSSVPFSPINLDKGPSTAAMDVELARLPAIARLPALDAVRFVVLFIPGIRCLNAKPRQSSRSRHRNRMGSASRQRQCARMCSTLAKDFQKKFGGTIGDLVWFGEAGSAVHQY